MKKLADFLYSIAITVWVGGMLAIGYVAAPVLFARLPGDRMLAGALAGDMFAVGGWIAIACGAYLLLFLIARHGWRCLRTLPFWLVAAMLALSLVGQFGIQPIIAEIKMAALPKQVMESALRDRFATWHGISSVVYLIESLLGLALVAVQERGKR